jgi:hypothetical protein
VSRVDIRHEEAFERTLCERSKRECSQL